MAQTLVSILVHVIFSTKNREALITPEIQPELFAYMGGLIREERGIRQLGAGVRRPKVLRRWAACPQGHLRHRAGDGDIDLLDGADGVVRIEEDGVLSDGRSKIHRSAAPHATVHHDPCPWRLGPHGQWRRPIVDRA